MIFAAIGKLPRNKTMKYTLRNFPRRIIHKTKTLITDVFTFKIRSPAVVAKTKSPSGMKSSLEHKKYICKQVVELEVKILSTHPLKVMLFSLMHSLNKFHWYDENKNNYSNNSIMTTYTRS